MITVLVANAPQVILSFLFLTYNGLYTCMLLADEWNGYVSSSMSSSLLSPAVVYVDVSTGLDMSLSSSWTAS